jgi:hypothetical protein
MIFAWIATLILLGNAIAFGWACWRCWRLRRRWRGLVYGALTLLFAAALPVSGVLFWYTHRDIPEPAQRTLYPGVEYTREIWTEPRPVIIHVVTIDLETPGLEFLVTPYTPTDGRVLAGQRTADFLETHDLQVAVNGDFFDPWWDDGPWRYYPQTGDPVDVRGITASQGDVYTTGFVNNRSDTLYIEADNTMQIGQPGGEIYHAISGYTRLVRDGIPLTFDVEPRNPYFSAPNPRTAVGIDENTLIIVVVDGRQINYSMGVTIEELAAIMARYGSDQALNLDGGGSSTLVIEGADGKADVINSPIHNRIPGRERPVANHLGVWVPRR